MYESSWISVYEIILTISSYGVFLFIALFKVNNGFISLIEFQVIENKGLMACMWSRLIL